MMFAAVLPGLVQAISRNRFRSGIALCSVILLWGAIVVASMGALIHYSNTPGAAARAPRQWPAESGLEPAESAATLVMFVHPHCPCTRASLSELEILLARCQQRPQTYVVFLQPGQFDEGWSQSGLWDYARSLPQVMCRRDRDGREARVFGAQTSGQAVVYDAVGQLLFQGGITSSRGHAGDNLGRTSLLAALQQQQTKAAQAREFCVFGCPLFREAATSREN